MTHHESILSQVRVASPCSARWEDMTGDDRARFCRHCEKNVYNLSSMTRAEAESLILEKEGRLCGRFHRRSDGTILTADCPTGRQVRHNRLTRWFGAACATFMLFVFGRTTLRSQEAESTQSISNAAQHHVTEPVLMGEVLVDPEIMGDIAVDPPIMGIIAVPTNTPPPATNTPPPTTETPAVMGRIGLPPGTHSPAPDRD